MSEMRQTWLSLQVWSHSTSMLAIEFNKKQFYCQKIILYDKDSSIGPYLIDFCSDKPLYQRDYKFFKETKH